MADEDALKGEAKRRRSASEAKLTKKRKGKAAKAAELERLKGVALAATVPAIARRHHLDDRAAREANFLEVTAPCLPPLQRRRPNGDPSSYSA